MTEQVTRKRLSDEALRGLEENAWYAYIVRCKDDSLYTGVAKDVALRVKRHNAGGGSKYCRSRLPVELVYTEYQASLGLALKRELEIKAMTREQKLELVSS